MLHNFDDTRNNFEYVSIPTARKLFERLGYSQAEAHPDGVDKDNFGIPENVVGEYPDIVASKVANHIYNNRPTEVQNDVNFDSTPIEVKSDKSNKSD